MTDYTCGCDITPFCTIHGNPREARGAGPQYFCGRCGEYVTPLVDGKCPQCTKLLPLIEPRASRAPGADRLESAPASAPKGAEPPVTRNPRATEFDTLGNHSEIPDSSDVAAAVKLLREFPQFFRPRTDSRWMQSGKPEPSLQPIADLIESLARERDRKLTYDRAMREAIAKENAGLRAERNAMQRRAEAAEEDWQAEKKRADGLWQQCENYRAGNPA